MIGFSGFTVLIAVILLVIFCVAFLPKLGGTYEPPEKRAGRIGEEYATKIIKSVLREGDRLFTNVEIECDGKRAELDNVVVNQYGVFIIEVKNYVGELYGREDDYQWQKVKVTDAGNAYEKTVDNPIRQVRRQVYVLAKFLERCNIHIWVDGYVILLHGNSPVKSNFVLERVDDIDIAIHSLGMKDTYNSDSFSRGTRKEALSCNTIIAISEILGNFGVEE